MMWGASACSPQQTCYSRVFAPAAGFTCWCIMFSAGHSSQDSQELHESSASDDLASPFDQPFSPLSLPTLTSLCCHLSGWACQGHWPPAIAGVISPCESEVQLDGPMKGCLLQDFARLMPGVPREDLIYLIFFSNIPRCPLQGAICRLVHLCNAG